MRLDFAKMHGTGNDFVFFDAMSRDIVLSPAQVEWICDRHFGIGADGVIVVRPSKLKDCSAYMHYINADGSLAQMCGNGIRCFAKYLVDRRIVDASLGHFNAETLAGIRPIEFRVDHDNKMKTATVDMGVPIFDPSLIPVAAHANGVGDDGVPFIDSMPLDSPWGSFSFTCVSMGNPHAVCFIDSWEDVNDGLFTDASCKSLETLRLDMVGSYFESHPAFPEKINVEFAAVNENDISMRVYERGCAETLACGTGACATNVAAALTSRAGRRNDVALKGGILKIDWSGADNHVFLTGPAAESFSGRVDVPDI